MRERLRTYSIYIYLGIALLLGLVMVVIGFGRYPSKSTLRTWMMKLLPPPTNTVVCKVGEETVTLADVKELVGYYEQASTGANNEDQTILSLYNSHSNTLGWRHYTLTSLVDRLADEKIILKKAAERGLYPLKEADQAALKTMAHRLYSKYEGQCKRRGLTEEQLLARFTVLEVETRLKLDVTKTITAPESEIKTAYDTLLAYEKENFDRSPGFYIQMANGRWKHEMNYDTSWGVPYSIPPKLLDSFPEGLLHLSKPSYRPDHPELLKPGTDPVLVYRPEGCILIRHIMIPLHESIDSEASARMAKNKTLVAHTKEKKLDENDYKEIQRIEQDVATEYLAKIKPKADQIMEQVRNGADFDEFIAELNNSTYYCKQFMNVEYLVASTPNLEGYFLRLIEHGGGLEKEGDIIGPIDSYYGYHIIQWADTVQAGPVPYEDVRDQVEAALLYDEREAAWAAALAQWRQEANVEVQTGSLPEDLPGIVY